MIVGRAALIGACLACLGGAATANSSAPPDRWVDPPRRSERMPQGALPVHGGITTIAAVNANDAAGNAALGEFSFVTVRGVVQIATSALDPFDAATASNWIYVADGTGGVAVVEQGAVSLSVAVGDSVEVFAPVFTRQPPLLLAGTRTLDVGQVPGFAYITRSTTGRPTQPASVVTADGIATSGASVEGSLVRVDGVAIVDPGEWPAPGSSAFVRVTDGSATFRLRIDEDTDLDNNSPPAAVFAVTGFVSQDDPSSPFLDGHVVYPRAASDLSQGDGSGIVTVAPSFVTQGASGVALAFTVTGQGAVLETIELDIPATWTWTVPGDRALAGAGFTGAASSFAPSGGGWIVTITGAAVTAADTGAITLSSLAAPSAVQTSTFAVRTAVAGGTPTPILGAPTVDVVSAALPGDVVVNELHPRTSILAQGLERGEFVELRNVSGSDLVIGGWTVSDIGRTTGCTLDARWAFPAGTTIPAGGFVVVCQTALDAPNSAGFLVDFPSFPGSALLFETHDSSVEPASADHAATPNMLLLDPSSGNDQMQLLGGPNTNGGQCESPVSSQLIPFAELVVLRSALGEVIDAVEFREPGPCTEDLCGGADPGGSGAADAYPYGPPKVGHTLGRDAASTDTGASKEDLRPSSAPTPGAINIPGDTVAPQVATPSANIALSATLLEIRYDEPVADQLAGDPANYAITVGGEARTVHEVLRDPVEPFLRYFLVTDALPPAATAALKISNVTDVAFDGDPGNVVDSTTIAVPVPGDAHAICEIQGFDEAGFSPLVGDTVTVAGYVTILPSASDRTSIWVQEPGAQGCGVNVFSFNTVVVGLQLTDLVRIRGRVTEFVSTTSGSGAVTEVASVDGLEFFRFVTRGLAGPEPRLVTTGAANDESLEGTLVRTEGTVINANSLAAWIDDGTGSVQVFQNFSALDLTRFTVGDRIDVTGVITQFDDSEPFLSGYELVPQGQEEIVLVQGGFASGGPSVRVARRVLVPSLGERMTIEVRTPRRSDVIIEIYDSVGRKATTLYDGVGLGEMSFEWDGRNQNGEIVDPGVYLCHVRAVALDGGSVVNDTAPVVVGVPLDGGGVAP